MYEEHGGKESWKRYARRSRREEHVRMRVIYFFKIIKYFELCWMSGRLA